MSRPSEASTRALRHVRDTAAKGVDIVSPQHATARRALPGIDVVDVLAVVSAGFWFGDESTPHPAFYSYTSPEPDGLADRPLRPDGAHGLPRNGSHLAILGYEQVRLADDARAAALAFYESTYRAGAGLASWDLDRHPRFPTSRHHLPFAEHVAVSLQLIADVLRLTPVRPGLHPGCCHRGLP